MSQFSARGTAWDAARLATLERDGYQCVQCGNTEQLEADHIIALSTILDVEERARLSLDPDNLRTLCKPCNGRKGNRTVTRSTWFSPRWLDRI